MKTAYPQFQGTTKIRLYSNIPFDNTYQHHSLISRFFKDDHDPLYNASDEVYGLPKERFINRKSPATGNPYIYPRYDLAGEYNFDYQNGLLASLVLELTAEQTNANYMRVESHNNAGSEYYYYFITGIQQVNTDTYRLSLELDVLMTYQDEFLNGIYDTPVATKRKHCHRFNLNGWPTCPDFKNNEDAFTGIKPTITTNKYELKLKGGMELLSDVSWLYIAYEPEPLGDFPNTEYKKCKLPVCMLCQPYNAKVRLSNGVYTISLSDDIEKLIGDGKIHGTKILPFPPFFDNDAVVTITYPQPDLKYYTISSPHIFREDSGKWRYRFYYDNTQVLKFNMTVVDNGEGVPAPLVRTLLLDKDDEGIRYEHKNISLENIEQHNNLSSLNNRIIDPRLLFSPFTKYVIASPYASEYEFYPELKYGNENYDNNFNNVFSFESVSTCYIGDSNITTYIKDDNYKYYNDLNIGLSANTNYNLPAGTNALDVFNSTQAQAYYQSKTASGITAGLTIAGGVGTAIIGGILTATGIGSVAGIGMMAGGVTATASGIASAVNNAKSVNAKIEDLKNTPDSFNVTGSNYISDYARTNENMPYVVIYESSNIVKQSANDFFYNYGYAVARDCYFNSELAFEYDELTDNNFFVRDIFNYIQLNEDITNKINANMPLIVKQKLSSIFINGITLWTFFRNHTLWGTTNVTYENTPSKWFLRHDLENAEFD